MSNISKDKVIPKLRFPEFQTEDEWIQSTLDDKFEFQDGFTFSSSHFSDSSLNAKQVIRITDINNHNKNGDKVYVPESLIRDLSLNKYLARKGDLLLSLTGAAGFNFFIWNSEEALLNQRTLKIIPKTKSDQALTILLEPLIHSKVNALGEGQNNNLSKEIFRQLTTFFPKPKEQQKIADCLSSLDELITAENQKLEALQLHKKGLMQQLFPAEGEKVPKLRFKEFRDSGEWQEKSLGSCLLREPEYGINAPAVPYSKELPTYLRITDISETGHFLSNEKVSVEKEVTENNYLEEGDIVLARTGASVGKSYKYKSEDGRLVFAGFLIRVKPDKEKLYSELLFQLLSSDRYWRWVKFTSARSGQPGINGTEYSSMMLSLPPTLQEQQKVSDCLSSLDNLMYRQNQKIENLKAHKKGLMQQLFPDVNDISA